MMFDCSPTCTQTCTHTNTHGGTGRPCLSQASILESAPQDYQTSRRLRQPPLSGNRFTSQPASSSFPPKCHFTFTSQRRFKAAHQDNLRIPTRRVHWQHFPPSLPFSLPHPFSAAAFAHAPPTSAILAHSSFPFPHFIPTAPSLRLSGWFQACCVWPDLVSCDWNSNYDSLPIAFPPTEKSRYLSSAALTLLFLPTCMRTRQCFSDLKNLQLN